jgi:addiction module HigA family antidote
MPKPKLLKPVTPGELLLEEFIKPMGISRYRLAMDIGVPPTRINEIVAGRRTVSADTDLRLCRYLGLSNGYWLRAQVAHDIEVAERLLRSELDEITPWAQRSEFFVSGA